MERTKQTCVKPRENEAEADTIQAETFRSNKWNKKLKLYQVEVGKFTVNINKNFEKNGYLKH